MLDYRVVYRFEAGLLKLKCHCRCITPEGGQCAEIYPKKPIYDIPGFPEVLAGDLVSNLLEQIKYLSLLLGEEQKLLKSKKTTLLS